MTTHRPNVDQDVTDAVVRLRHDEMRQMVEFGLDHYPEEPPLDVHAFRLGMGIARQDPPFAALILAALYRADSTNARIIRAVFPTIAATGQARYDAPGGVLHGEQSADE